MSDTSPDAFGEFAGSLTVPIFLFTLLTMGLKLRKMFLGDGATKQKDLIEEHVTTIFEQTKDVESQLKTIKRASKHNYENYKNLRRLLKHFQVEAWSSNETAN